MRRRSMSDSADRPGRRGRRSQDLRGRPHRAQLHQRHAARRISRGSFDKTFEYNDLREYCTISGDLGGIYSFQSSKPGRQRGCSLQLLQLLGQLSLPDLFESRPSGRRRHPDGQPVRRRSFLWQLLQRRSATATAATTPARRFSTTLPSTASTAVQRQRHGHPFRHERHRDGHPEFSLVDDRLQQGLHDEPRPVELVRPTTAGSIRRRVFTPTFRHSRKFRSR